MAIKNQSMLRDLYEDPVDVFAKKVGRNYSNISGTETPLGHTYSLILESLAREGHDATPNVKEFLDYIDSVQERYNRGTSLKTPTYYPSITRPAMEYAKKRGLSELGEYRILAEIIGNSIE